MTDKIKVGDYIIIQRQNYTKLHKYGKADSTVVLAKDNIELNNIENADYNTVFRMNIKESGRKRLFFLEPTTDTVNLKEVLDIKESGVDNRDIKDDGQSQTLSNEEILEMRDNFTSSSEIVGKIVANSKSFSSKTEYSQEKYIKKKERKYFEFIQIKRPSIRLLTELFYRQDPDKILGIRLDSLSQIISYSGVSSDGNYLLFESGSNGLLPATLLNSMGSSGNARLVHMHPGSYPQKTSVLALNLEEDHMKKCISVNIYSVLRQFYQKSEDNQENGDSKKRKLEDEEPSEENAAKKHVGETEVTEKPLDLKVPAKVPKWQEENREAIEILNQKVDCLIVASREHPLSIVKELMQFVAPSRPIVIFNLSKEILMDCYFELKNLGNITNLRLTSNWMRMYQILPQRTHPVVSMQGNSGFLLVGWKVQN
jgi:tRNA (adenine-N(1)-)-methyltransferase non-catalytic subunit